MRDGVSKEYLNGTRRGNRPHFKIENFLTSKIGSHWDKIYKEISEAFDKRTIAGKVLFRSLQYWVESSCYIEDKKVYSHRSDVLVDGFYIHPVTKCLQYQKRPKRERYSDEPKTLIKIDDTTAYSKERYLVLCILQKE